MFLDLDNACRWQLQRKLRGSRKAVLAVSQCAHFITVLYSNTHSYTYTDIYIKNSSFDEANVIFSVVSGTLRTKRTSKVITRVECLDASLHSHFLRITSTASREHLPRPYSIIYVISFSSVDVWLLSSFDVPKYVVYLYVFFDVSPVSNTYLHFRQLFLVQSTFLSFYQNLNLSSTYATFVISFDTAREYKKTCIGTSHFSNGILELWNAKWPPL